MQTVKPQAQQPMCVSRNGLAQNRPGILLEGNPTPECHPVAVTAKPSRGPGCPPRDQPPIMLPCKDISPDEAIKDERGGSVSTEPLTRHQPKPMSPVTQHPHCQPFQSLLQMKVRQRNSVPCSLSPDGPSGRAHMKKDLPTNNVSKGPCNKLHRGGGARVISMLRSQDGVNQEQERE